MKKNKKDQSKKSGTAKKRTTTIYISDSPIPGLKDLFALVGKYRYGLAPDGLGKTSKYLINEGIRGLINEGVLKNEMVVPERVKEIEEAIAKRGRDQFIAEPKTPKKGR